MGPAGYYSSEPNLPTIKKYLPTPACHSPREHNLPTINKDLPTPAGPPPREPIQIKGVISIEK